MNNLLKKRLALERRILKEQLSNSELNKDDKMLKDIISYYNLKISDINDENIYSNIYDKVRYKHKKYVSNNGLLCQEIHIKIEKGHNTKYIINTNNRCYTYYKERLYRFFNVPEMREIIIDKYNHTIDTTDPLSLSNKDIFTYAKDDYSIPPTFIINDINDFINALSELQFKIIKRNKQYIHIERKIKL